MKISMLDEAKLSKPYDLLHMVCKSYSTFKNHMVYLLHESMVEVFF